MHLESLIEELGGFGCYQGILVVLIAMTKVTLASSMLMMAFAGVDPGWWCLAPDDDRESLYLTPANISYKNCDWNQTCIRHFDDTMVTIVTEWDLTCDKKWISNTIISIQMAGVFVGSIIAGHFADRYGRKKVLFLSVLLGMIGNIISAFSVHWIMFTVLRVALGIAVGMMIAVNYLYISEFVGRKYRSFIAALPSWGVGVVLFAGLMWGIPHWKWLHLTAAGISFPFLFGWFFVPESLRWLAAKGRLKEAREVINNMAKYNGKPVPDTSILELIAAEEKAEGDKARDYTYLDLFRTRSLLKRTILTCYIWFSQSVVYYAISFGVKKLSGNFFMNMMIMAILELPVLPAVLFVTSIFGRRWSCASLFFLASLCLVCCGISSHLAPPELKGKLENIFAQLARFFTITVWHIVQALTSEQYPTVIRNLAYAAQSTTARVGGILAGQVLSLGGKDDLMAPFLAMGALIFLNGVACFFLRETKGKAMEDTMATELVTVSKSKANEARMENGTFVASSDTEVVVEHVCQETAIDETETDSADRGVYHKLLSDNRNDVRDDDGYNGNEVKNGVNNGENGNGSVEDINYDDGVSKDGNNLKDDATDGDNNKKGGANDGVHVKDDINDDDVGAKNGEDVKDDVHVCKVVANDDVNDAKNDVDDGDDGKNDAGAGVNDCEDDVKDDANVCDVGNDGADVGGSINNTAAVNDVLGDSSYSHGDVGNNIDEDHGNSDDGDDVKQDALNDSDDNADRPVQVDNEYTMLLPEVDESGDKTKSKM